MPLLEPQPEPMIDAVILAKSDFKLEKCLQWFPDGIMMVYLLRKIAAYR